MSTQNQAVLYFPLIDEETENGEDTLNFLVNEIFSHDHPIEIRIR